MSDSRVANDRVHDLPAERPIVESTIEFLRERYLQGRRLDLSGLAIVVPSAAAGRRLRQRLALSCQDEGLEWRPPLISTVGQLPELLYQPKRPFASETLQQWVWVAVLRDLDPSEFSALFTVRPDPEDWLGWLDLGQLIQGLHRELASETLSIEQVIDHAGPRLPDPQRWRVLQRVQQRYLEQLDALGYWDRQTARTFAIEHDECHSDRELILLAAVDLNQSMRRMLDQVASRVTLLQVRPARIEDPFDHQGCLNLEAWVEARFPLEKVDIVIADEPDDQALAALEFLQAHATDISLDQVTIGVPDETLIPNLKRQAEHFEVPVRDLAGQRVGDLAIGHWLRTLLDWVETRSFRSFAALVRHPMVFERLSRLVERTDWLEEVDTYHANHLPALLQRVYPGTQNRLVQQLVGYLDHWCEPVFGATKQPLATWGQAWTECLVQVLGNPELDDDDPLDHEHLTALTRWRDAVAEAEGLPVSIQPVTTAATAFRFLLRQVLASRVPETDRESGIPLMGWLDLPFDDATHVAVTGFNEGRVPSAEGTELFLSNQLRRELGMMHRSRRLARDAYYLCLLIEGRRSLRLIAGRQTADHDPLSPSRLLFHDDPETVARRALACFETPPRRYEVVSTTSPVTASAEWRLQLPRPRSWTPPWRLSPTDFRRFLECPYRFYLRKRFGLQTLTDADTELGPGEFGELLHDVLRQFGEGAAKHSEQADVIEDWLMEALQTTVQERLGLSHHPAVDLQVEHARRRLVDFAEHQAKWAAQGWRIQAVEESAWQTTLATAEGAVTIGGRLDRIDRHLDLDEWVVLDYKSSEAGLTPEQSHRKKNAWIDFQLPLYYWMATQADEVTGPIRVGYIVLSRDAAKNGFQLAAWSAEDFESARDEATQLAAQIVRGESWPPAILDTFHSGYDDFAPILSLEPEPWDEPEA